MISHFKTFIENLIVEALHPELQSIVTGAKSRTSKKTQLVNKIKELSARGEKTGIEGNMPKGSSRAYMKHDEPHEVHIDGKPATLKTGTKVAIKATMDKHHDARNHEGRSLGEMQNHAENGDHFVNRHYRVLSHLGENKFHSNEAGIFPPLIDHDEEHHQWAHVGHVDSIKSDSHFRKLTKTESHPQGISHRDFVNTLVRSYDKNNGKHWDRGSIQEARMDHAESHPLVDKFLAHQNDMAMPPHDYHQRGNLGVWTHPHTGEQHIVARDHGFNTDVMEAYGNANRNRMFGHAAKPHTYRFS